MKNDKYCSGIYGQEKSSVVGIPEFVAKIFLRKQIGEPDSHRRGDEVDQSAHQQQEQADVNVVGDFGPHHRKENIHGICLGEALHHSVENGNGVNDASDHTTQ